MSSADKAFRKTFGLAAVALLLLLSQPTESRVRRPVRQGTPFTISSLGSPFGVQLKVEGTYTVNETNVEVYVERALVYVSEHCPYQGRRFVRTISVGLATTTPRGRWDTENRSLPVFVEREMRPREEYRLAGLHLRIPRSEGADLSKRWLVVEAEDLALDLPENDRDREGYAFAHSRRNIFAEPGVEP